MGGGMMEGRKHDFRRLNADSFITVPTYAIAEGGLGLSGAELLCYGLVYSFRSEREAGEYYGSLDYTCARLGLSRSTAQRALKSLCNQGLVSIVGKRPSTRGQSRSVYSIDQDSADAAREAFDAYWSQDSIALQNDADSEKVSKSGLFPGDAIAITSDPDPVARVNAASEGREAPDGAYFPSDAPNGPERASDGPDTEKAPESGLIGEKGVKNGPFPGSKGPRIGRKSKGVLDQTLQPTNMDQAVSSHEDLDGRTGCFEQMAARSVNRNLLATPSGLAATRSAFDALVAQGHDPNDIQRAWIARIDACHAEGRGEQYFPQLKRWLENTAPSLLASLQKPQRPQMAREHVIPEDPTSRDSLEERQQRLAKRDEKFARLVAAKKEAGDAMLEAYASAKSSPVDRKEAMAAMKAASEAVDEYFKAAEAA